MKSQAAGRIPFIVLTVLTVYLMYLIFRPFLSGIAWAVVLVVAFQPLYERIARWLGGRTRLAAALVTALVAAFVVLPTLLAVIKVSQGVGDAREWFEGLAADGTDLQDLPWINDLRVRIGDYIDLDKLDLRAMVLSALRTVGAAMAGRTTALVTNAVQSLLTFVVLLLTMFVLFQEGPRLLQVARRFLPLSEPDKEAAIQELNQVTHAVFFGVLLTALAQGVIGGFGTAIVGLPSPFVFGAAMFFAALLPGGTMLVWGPAAIWLFATSAPWKGVVMVVWGIGVSTIDNVLRPMFIGRGVRIHMLLVFFGIFGGMMAFGLVGLFIGPLVITLFLILLDVARREYLGEPSTSPAQQE